jgi:hypothetical protein
MPRKKHVAVGWWLAMRVEVEAGEWVGARTSYDHELGKVCPGHCDEVWLRASLGGWYKWVCVVRVVVQVALIVRGCSEDAMRNFEVVPNKEGGGPNG